MITLYSLVIVFLMVALGYLYATDSDMRPQDEVMYVTILPLLILVWPMTFVVLLGLFSLYCIMVGIKLCWEKVLT